MVSVCYAVDGRSVVIIGRGGHPCVALICSVARIAEKKTNEVNRSERRYTVDSVQCFSSKHWAVCPPLLAQPVDFRLSLISNQLKSFEFLRLNTSKFLGLGSWRRSSKVWPRQITSNQPKGGRKWQSRRSDQLCLFRPPTTIIDYLLQSILMLAMLRYIDWDKFTERKNLRKFVNAHLSVSGTVPKTHNG